VRGDTTKYNELIDLLEQGESKRLNDLMSDMRAEVVDYMRYKFSLNQKEAEEHAQNAIYQLLNRLQKDGFKPLSVGGYTAVCAQNNYLRKYRDQKVVMFMDVSDWIIPKEPEPLADLYLSDARSITERAINRMSETAQRVTRLYMDAPDLDYKDAADIIGISRVNLRTIKSRSFTKLRDHLAPLLAVD
jgi:RNA polymerase sigma factor (sigma-70 family)